ncbi:hypothetical protein MBEHAL_1860 [Halarchaeum acidiphilum MH1-52-1]|uniref:Uncharacterized protein n=1 Tax=Halarchaeum acidiphilum MH1-52-1 TaxID=1261545 RepID=U2YVP1_9EURY|nr:hypothetical protein [Halarchaeum acidiphilum]GAD53100.1 hypothetical protein MBEHAL_1860 [Halarchaeum acidiphilum MH1-52-1]
MKPGASDPFADDEEEGDAEIESDATDAGAAEDEEVAEPETPASGVTEPKSEPSEASGSVDEGSESDETAAESASPGSPAASENADDESDAESGAASDAPLELPYIYRRDKVKDERPDVHQLFVRDDTDMLARDAERDLEKLLGEDVYRLDAREAIYLAGMRHLDEAADVLREWGYDR